jgi:hypothetical protein
VSQLDEKYGALAGDALRSGMLYELHLRSGDQRTVDYARFRLGGGSEHTDRSYASGHEDSQDSAVTSPVGTALLQELQDGEGFLVTPNGRARVCLPMYSELEPETRRVLTSQDSAGARAADPVSRR